MYVDLQDNLIEGIRSNLERDAGSSESAEFMEAQVNPEEEENVCYSNYHTLSSC